MAGSTPQRVRKRSTKGPQRVRKRSTKLRGGQILKHWREQGPSWIPKGLKPYWKRLCCEVFDWRDLKYQVDNDRLYELALTLQECETGVGDERLDAATITARRNSRKDYREQVSALRELIQVRKNTAAPKRTGAPNRPGGKTIADLGI